MSEPVVKPVVKCACGADCPWCVAANDARKAFPDAIRPPPHDNARADQHACARCFVENISRRAVAK